MIQKRNSLFFLFLLLVACSEKKIADGYFLYESKEHGISMVLPSDWIIQQDPEEGTIFSLNSNKTSEDDVFTESFNLQYIAEEGHTLDELFEQNVAYLQQMTGIEIVSNTSKDIEGVSTKVLEFSTKYKDVEMVTLQYYFYENGVFYVVTALSAQNSYKDYKPMFVQVLESFKVN